MPFVTSTEHECRGLGFVLRCPLVGPGVRAVVAEVETLEAEVAGTLEEVETVVGVGPGLRQDAAEEEDVEVAMTVAPGQGHLLRAGLRAPSPVTVGIDPAAPKGYGLKSGQKDAAGVLIFLFFLLWFSYGSLLTSDMKSDFFVLYRLSPLSSPTLSTLCTANKRNSSLCYYPVVRSHLAHFVRP